MTDKILIFLWLFILIINILGVVANYMEDKKGALIFNSFFVGVFTIVVIESIIKL